ncbi:mitochondrial substrate carrier family protein [Striga asiatica]|uniref:Mitochondrial substrate carrier family protein n=1 Tax=Striga asiatica TaxID=4170 RepID=A0A5A7RD06_STRAF|nr:mitochondrial substrate carrier family protein [Striga asiatica]
MSDALINGLAGAGGGIIAQLITYPLQTVNTRQQTERDSKKEKPELGVVDQMCQVVKQEGWGRLYGGLAPSIVGTAASQVNLFSLFLFAYAVNKAELTALERKKKGIGDGSVGMLSSLMVAALSGCVNVLLTNPIWVVVTRMQVKDARRSCSIFLKYAPQPPPSLPPLDLAINNAKLKLNERIYAHIIVGSILQTHTKKRQPNSTDSPSPKELILSAVEPLPFGTTHAIQEVYGEAGVLGFWKGVFPTLIMVSNPSIQFMLYETFLKKLKKQRLLSSKGANGVTALEIFLLGALAKLGATVVTYPLLVVKSRLQAKQNAGGDKRHQYRGTLDAILKMLRYEGFYGFYKGMGTKVVQSVLAAAVLFMVKEELVRGSRWLLTKRSVGSVKPKLH